MYALIRWIQVIYALAHIENTCNQVSWRFQGFYKLQSKQTQSQPERAKEGKMDACVLMRKVYMDR